MKSRATTALIAIAVAGWGLGVWAVFRSFDRPAGPSSWSHRTPEPAIVDTPTVVRVDDLKAAGFDSVSLAHMAPHLRVLNAAMASLIKYHSESKSAPSMEARRYAASEAVIFHETAHRHEQEIEALLSARMRARFHSYMLAREENARLPADSTWHAPGAAPNAGWRVREHVARPDTSR